MALDKVFIAIAPAVGLDPLLRIDCADTLLSSIPLLKKFITPKDCAIRLYC